MCGSSYHTRHRSWHGKPVWPGRSRTPSGACGLVAEGWSNPPKPSLAHPQNHLLTLPSTPPGLRSGSRSTLDQHCRLSGGGGRIVSSSLLISVGDLWTGLASLLLCVMIKYYPSAQLIPTAKGKSLCPHVICKLSLSLRTDLFTCAELLLHCTVLTLRCLTSLFNAIPSHSCCSVWRLNISLLKGEKGG